MLLALLEDYFKRYIIVSYVFVINQYHLATLVGLHWRISVRAGGKKVKGRTQRSHLTNEGSHCSPIPVISSYHLNKATGQEAPFFYCIHYNVPRYGLRLAGGPLLTQLTFSEYDCNCVDKLTSLFSCTYNYSCYFNSEFSYSKLKRRVILTPLPVILSRIM